MGLFFKIKVFDYDEASSPDLIGVCSTTLKELKKVKKDLVEWDLINARKQVSL